VIPIAVASSLAPVLWRRADWRSLSSVCVFPPGQVRLKQTAIRALEVEREQCLQLERRLQTEMRCDRRVTAAAAASTEDGFVIGGGGESDDGDVRSTNKRRSCRPRRSASDDEREVP